MSNPNLIVNGDFAHGRKDFTSDYSYAKPNPDHATGPGEYSVITNPATDFANPFNSYGDHTSGSGRMLFVDGQASGSFWAETVTLAAGKTYVFSYFDTGADSNSPGHVALSLNGTALNDGVVVSGVGPDWRQVTVSFTTGAAGAYDLALSDTNGQAAGNDFTIDDISLRGVNKVARADNLLANGDFSKGVKHFTSDYQYIAPNAGHSTTVHQYSVITNPSTAFTNGYESYGDHTSGSGNMLFVDGTNTGSFWKETVSLAADTTYSFRYFVTGADGGNLPSISFAVNGATVDAGFHVTTHGGVWREAVESFTTGAAGAYTLALGDTNGTAEGNDFTVDDLSLTSPAAGAAHGGGHEHLHQGHATHEAMAAHEVAAGYDHMVI